MCIFEVYLFVYLFVYLQSVSLCIFIGRTVSRMSLVGKKCDLGSGRGYALALQLMYKVGKVGGAGRGVLSVESCAVRLNQTSARVTRRATNSIKNIETLRLGETA